ncbi:MAG: hypothetical protein FDZ75_06430 [Actinobacteria bacterium]|nr:MAG: hypothetical protein FDZ75_06430 [Actinomycetota bacterium]
MASINERIAKFVNDMATDVVEERVIEYIVREVHNGRNLMEVLEDPYVRNRLNDEKRAHVIESPDIVTALEQEIREAMTLPEAGF